MNNNYIGEFAINLNWSKPNYGKKLFNVLSSPSRYCLVRKPFNIKTKNKCNKLTGLYQNRAFKLRKTFTK